MNDTPREPPHFFYLGMHEGHFAMKDEIEELVTRYEEELSYPDMCHVLRSVADKIAVTNPKKMGWLWRVRRSLRM